MVVKYNSKKINGAMEGSAREIPKCSARNEKHQNFGISKKVCKFACFWVFDHFWGWSANPGSTFRPHFWSKTGPLFAPLFSKKAPYAHGPSPKGGPEMTPKVTPKVTHFWTLFWTPGGVDFEFRGSRISGRPPKIAKLAIFGGPKIDQKWPLFWSLFGPPFWHPLNHFCAKSPHMPLQPFQRGPGTPPKVTPKMDQKGGPKSTPKPWI